jgi:hypothetical protein
VRELPAIDTMATLAHVGQVNDTHSGYGELGTWIEQNMRKWEQLFFQRSFPSTPQETHGWFDHRGYRPVPLDREEQDRRSFFLFRML